MPKSIDGCSGLERLGFFSERLTHSMAALKLTAKKLAPLLGCSYEFVRRMIRCESLLSISLLDKMWPVFHWKKREIEKLIMADQCRRKYGSCFCKVLEIDPRMEPVYIPFPYLTPSEL